MEVSPVSPLKCVALRLQPGEDIRHELAELLRRHHWKAAAVLSGLGSLSQAQLRLAGAQETVLLDRPLEIVSLAGTLSPDGCHLHISVSDASGHILGGHLQSPSPVRTTAEVILGILEDSAFYRRPDPSTGFKELTFRAQDEPPRNR